MALASGTQLGTYTLTSLVGAGGMGEVYAAHDSKLGRNVAIKVLPEQFARDPERLSRFQREAKMLAALNHPNIAAIYGLEQSGDTHYLVMELVPGQTLAERIRTGPVPLDEALAIAKQIGEALEAAHGSEKGIIHRDLKPANVKVTPEGRVKVLDFGLAKAFANDVASQDSSNSPTLSALPTMQGVIMGTAAYMSPEQARGKTVTKASDIWAFGCVLYELLTGKQAFPGDDVTDILAVVLRAEPDWNRLPEATPPAIRTLLKRCLRKERQQRLQDATDVRIEIEDVLSGATTAEPAAATTPIGRLAVPGRTAWAVAAVAAAVAVAAASWGTFLYLQPAPAEPQAVRFSVAPPQGTRFSGQAPFLSISPDGSKLAFVGVSVDPSAKRQLWIRSLDTEAAQPLPGTENPDQPFWSADSRFLAFFSDGKLKRVAISGGPAQILADAPVGTTGTWNREGVILFATGIAFSAQAALESSMIRRVPANGGAVTAVTTLDASRGDIGHYWPHFLPDGRHFLYLVRSSNPENSGIYAASLDSPERKLVVSADSNAVYLAPGYLVFHREGTLMVQPFDTERLETAGEEIPVAEGVQFIPELGRAAFAASENGVLAYRTGAGTAGTQLAWFDRIGRQAGTLGEPAGYGDVDLSPDGKRAAVSIVDPARKSRDLWIYDIARGLRTRFTFGAANEQTPAWSPDSSRIIFGSNIKGRYDLYRKAADGSASEELLLEGSTDKFSGSWSPDGRFLCYAVGAGPAGVDRDLFVLPLSGDASAGSGQAASAGSLRDSGQVRQPISFLQTQFVDSFCQLSPDGRWVAYVSNESRRLEVYVAPFPASSGKWQVSTAGGEYPRWRGDGKEIFYRAPDSKLMAAEVSGTGPSFQVGAVKPLFQMTAFLGARWPYDVTADGQRFLINTNLELEASAPITVIVNWMAGMKK